MKDNPPLIDTNILIYAYDVTPGRKHQIAKDLLAKVWSHNKVYSISTQNLSEFYVIATKKIPNPLNPEQAKAVISDILDFSHWNVLTPKPQTVKKAIEYVIACKSPYWDCLLAATMTENGITTIYTENVRDFKKIPHLTVENPFVP